MPREAPRRVRAGRTWPGGGLRSRWGRPGRLGPILAAVVAVRMLAFVWVCQWEKFEIVSRLYLTISRCWWVVLSPVS